MTRSTAPGGVMRALHLWYLVERWIAVIAFSLMGLLIFADVAGREFLGPVGRALGFEMGATGVYGAGKMALFLLVIATFAGLSLSVASGAQIVPQVAFKWVPARWSGSIDRLGNLVSAAVFFAMAYYGAIFVISSRSIGTVMPGLDWPVWIIQTAIPIGFASSALRYLTFAIWPETAPKREEMLE